MLCEHCHCLIPMISDKIILHRNPNIMHIVDYQLFCSFQCLGKHQAHEVIKITTWKDLKKKEQDNIKKMIEDKMPGYEVYLKYVESCSEDSEG